MSPMLAGLKREKRRMEEISEARLQLDNIDYILDKAASKSSKLSSKLADVPIKAVDLVNDNKGKFNNLLKQLSDLMNSIFFEQKNMREDLDLLRAENVRMNEENDSLRRELRECEHNGDDDVSDDIEVSETPFKKDATKVYLSTEEYKSLSSIERNQLALDRFWSKNKSKRMIGKLYEQYIGYLYERKGWIVNYFGISEGLSDLGRDLICYKDNVTLLVQCKNWAQHKVIHEKHIFQLFGTTYAYKEHMSRLGFNDIRGVFYTSASLSDVARSFAKEFQIEFHEGFLLRKFPIIKCHVNRDGVGIYHLPFDQQYFKTKINPKNGDFYCATVAEAETEGFRRAYR